MPSATHKWRSTLFHYATACSLIIGLLTGCSSDDSGSSPRYGGSSGGIPVVTKPIALTDLEESLTSVGTARALKSVSVYAETSGRVTGVAIDADMWVEAGTILLQLDDRDELLAVELAEVRLADAERMVRRYTTVNAQNTNIPESQIDDARAAVDSARITLEQARVTLDRRRILAPFAGHVGITEIDVGDRIDTNTLVTTIDDRSQLLVNFAVPEVYVERVSRGTPVAVKLWDAADKATYGEVVAVDSRVDINSRAFTARAAIDNSEDQFRPGMAFEISFAASRGKFLSIPDVSLQWGADGSYVWVANGDRAERREVQLVKRLTGNILIEGDLREGEQVIMEGVQAVREGAPLKVLSAAELDFNTRDQLLNSASQNASGL